MTGSYPPGGVPLDLPRRRVTVLALSPAIRPGIAIWRASGSFSACSLQHIAVRGHPTVESVVVLIEETVRTFGVDPDEVVCGCAETKTAGKYRDAELLVIEAARLYAGRRGLPFRLMSRAELYEAHGSDWLDLKAVEAKWHASGFHDPVGTFRTSAALGVAWVAGLVSPPGAAVAAPAEAGKAAPKVRKPTSSAPMSSKRTAKITVPKSGTKAVSGRKTNTRKTVARTR